MQASAVGHLASSGGQGEIMRLVLKPA